LALAQRLDHDKWNLKHNQIFDLAGKFTGKVDLGTVLRSLYKAATLPDLAVFIVGRSST
jgi:hypothetical protein